MTTSKRKMLVFTFSIIARIFLIVDPDVDGWHSHQGKGLALLYLPKG